MAQKRVIYMIAGEPSGDAIGEKLITAIRNQYGTDVQFVGLGGAAMETVGFKSKFPISELSVMGLVEILPHIQTIFARIRETADDIVIHKPDVVVTIDSPSFALRVVKQLVGRYKCHKIHVVAPTVWAWRPKRVHKFNKYFDHLLTILPFEPPYFKRAGLASEFIGHPVLEYGIQKADGRQFRTKHGIDKCERVICVLPGSRKGEIARHLNIFRDALSLFRSVQDEFSVVIPTISAVRSVVEEGVSDWPSAPIIVTTPLEKYQAMQASNLALVASGTAALETAIAAIPSVVAYKVSPITAFIIRRLIKVDYVNIINLLADNEVIPEYLQERCTAENLACALKELTSSSGEVQVRNVQSYIGQLTLPEGKASDVAARYILKVMAAKGQAE